VTPSSSGLAHKGHVWVRCDKPNEVGNGKFTLEDPISGISAGDLRSSGGQVRLRSLMSRVFPCQTHTVLPRRILSQNGHTQPASNWPSGIQKRSKVEKQPQHTLAAKFAQKEFATVGFPSPKAVAMSQQGISSGLWLAYPASIVT
jgi:hypothetical protein